MEHAVSENINAGNAMSRRSNYQYGQFLPAHPYGHVDQSIGKNTARGSVGLIPPTLIIKEDFETHIIDGVKMVFQNTPGTEAPAEMNTWFPDMKAFWAAENITGTIHNIYTIRGAEVRDALAWAKGINEALYRYGTKAEVMFASHSWPRWGNQRIQEVMRGQRDTYAHMNNHALHLANQGVTINEIQNVYVPPKSLQQEWYARGYHGSFEHNSRGIINKYLGYWDGNLATLTPLSPKDSAPLYVEMMGGPKKILKKGRKLIKQGQYHLAVEILNKLIYAKPKNQKAKDLLADAYEQLGYQYESPSLRNTFLNGAHELRNGVKGGENFKSAGPDMISAMSTELFLDFLAIKMDTEKAEGLKFIINLQTPDNGEKFVIEVSNATMTTIKGFLSPEPHLELEMTRNQLLPVMMGQKTFAQQLDAGHGKS